MDLVPMSADDQDKARERVKLESTRRYMELLDSLGPYIDGTLGPVSPNHAAVYLKTVRELNLLWDAYAKPKAVEDVKGGDEEPMVLEARQAQVSAELDKLREVGMRGRPRS